MAKAKQKTKKMGYRLKINRTGAPGAKNWEQVGFLFPTTYAANKFRRDSYPQVKAAIVEGVRINTEPVTFRSGSSEELEGK